MNKKLLASAICVATLSVSAAFAATTVSLPGFNVKVNTPTTTTASSKTTTTTTASQAAMKKQIASIMSEATSISSTYETAINNLTNAILPADELKTLQEQKAKIQKKYKEPVNVEINVASNGAVSLNKFLKSDDAISTLKNLPANKKATIKTNLKNLASVRNKYIATTGKTAVLVDQVKADPIGAALMGSDFKQLLKLQKEMPKQAKQIATLTASLTKTATKAGVKVK